MSRNGFFEAVREIRRDPVLLLVEIGWRWSFGAIAIIAFCFSAFLVLDSIPLDSRSLQTMAALNPFQLAQKIAEGIASVAGVLWRAELSVGFVVTAIWILFSALGRYATLMRAALKPGASLQVCLVVSILRAMLIWGCIAAWFLAGLFAGAIASANTQAYSPNVGLMSAILFVAFLVISGVWSTLNWVLSLVPLRTEPTSSECFRETLSFIRVRRDELLEVSIVNGTLRAGVFVVAVLLSMAAGTVITNARIFVADLLAISLLYFLLADFLYVARLIAFAKFRGEPVTEPSVVVRRDLRASTGTSATDPAGCFLDQTSR
jgi:hypothetical protein